MEIEIMDTTLRDGEQTAGVAFSENEKLNIAKVLLSELKVDRIEVGSARISDGEFIGVKKIIDWAKENNHEKKVEVLGFVDKTKSVDWISKAGGKVINLLCKGSLKHVKGQLKKEPEEHFQDIKEVIKYANQSGIDVNVYLEDWSNGMKNSPEYVFQMMDSLKEQPIKRFMLPDTLGVLNNFNTEKFCEQMVKKYPNLLFDFHAHNDYNLAVSNTLSAARAGVHAVHTTINGLGERTGNAPLASVVASLKDHLDIQTRIDEAKLMKSSKLVELFSGIRMPNNMPVVGEVVFTQCCGIHADGDSKGNLYCNDLMPERFGRRREYALGKTSGKASIKKNLDELGIELDDDQLKRVLHRVVELGDKKENITVHDLPFIISDVLGRKKERVVNIRSYQISHSSGLKPTATMLIDINGKEYEEHASGDGQYDAFMKALKKAYSKENRVLPQLVDYVVSIPPGGKTDALVETVITWKNGETFKTRGVDSDQTSAAIEATVKMLNIVEEKN